MRGLLSKRHAPLWLLLVLAAAAPILGLYPVLGMRVLCFALFAAGFNLLAGYGGLLSFGHAALFGSGGYLAGLALTQWGWPTAAGIAFGTAFAALLGLLIGALAVRRHGIYFSMVTLAVAQIVYFFFLQAGFTGGEDGLQGIPRGSLFGLSLDSDRVLYEVVLVVVVAALVLQRRIVDSPFGQVLQAVRENESRAISLGYRPQRIKLAVFVMSAAFAGLAGSLKALAMGFETLTDAHWSTSGLVILMTLVGGLGTDFGPLVGALLVTLLDEKIGGVGQWLAQWSGIGWFGQLGDSVGMVTGAVFVVCVLALRRGIVGELLARWRRPAAN